MIKMHCQACDILGGRKSDKSRRLLIHSKCFLYKTNRKEGVQKHRNDFFLQIKGSTTYKYNFSKVPFSWIRFA